MRVAMAMIVCLATPASALADDVPAEAVARVRSGRLHLVRNLVWGGASVALGAGLVLGSERTEHPTRWAFGVQTAAWGAIDVGIATAGLIILRGPAAGRTRGELIDKERLYHDALLFNMGLDVAYMAAGAAIYIAGRRGVDNAAEWCGHGSAIIVQGAALLAFELIAWRGTRARLDALVAPVATGDGLGLATIGTF